MYDTFCSKFTIARPHRIAAALLAFALAVPAGAALADRRAPPDPSQDAMLITAGFLEHHQDIKYRMLGIEAYKQKRYEDAMRFFRRAGYYADKPSQAMVAEMYWNGHGTAADRALAYAWMDLAAERGYRSFLVQREKFWLELSATDRTRAVGEGEALYAQFGDAAAKPRYERKLRMGRRDITGSRTGFNRGVTIQVPGPAGQQSIEGSKFYDERYWDAKQYWAWQDKIWTKPAKVRVGDIEVTSGASATSGSKEASRIPKTEPQVDTQPPEVPNEPAQAPPPR
jgi:hypothetical protein